MMRHFRKGDPLTSRAFREQLNKIVDMYNAVEKMSGDGRVTVNHTRTGVVIGLSRKQVSTADPIPIGVIVMWSGAVVDIPDRWALCDGGEYCLAHGIKDHDCGTGLVTTVDLSGRFVMGIDEDGRTDEDAPGETGGYRWHGITENNHPRHEDHMHDVDGAGGILVDTNADGATDVISRRTTEQRYGTCEAMHLRHGGITDSWDVMDPVHGAHTYKDTDNRPRYYVLAFIQRIR